MQDWDNLRFFLAVARWHTLAEAARRLHVTQSTVGRRLEFLKEEIGARLLNRTTNGYVLTLAGESIRAHVERVEAEMLSVERAVAGHDIRQKGLVRVASSQLVTSHLLAPCFAALHSRHRDIRIDALPDLLDKPMATYETDIAVRLRRFEQQDFLVRNIGTVAFGLYGSRAYFARVGEPDLGSGCPGHQLITLLDDRELSAQAAWLTEHAGNAQIVLKADSYETQHWAAFCGGGLALLPRFRADAEPLLRRIRATKPIPSAEIWLGVNSENRQVPRIRTVLDYIAEAVHSRSTLLNPADLVDALG